MKAWQVVHARPLRGFGAFVLDIQSGPDLGKIWVRSGNRPRIVSCYFDVGAVLKDA